MISVALCTYNGEKYIKEQLISILNQTVPVDEIVICDDRSKDKTIEVVDEIKKNTGSGVVIRSYINETNLGVTNNFEKALSLCKGDIIFLSDQDDIWVENKVEYILDVFNNDDDCLLVFTDAYLVDANGQDIGKSLWDVSNPPQKEIYTFQDFLGLRFVTGATVAIRRELLSHSIPIPSCWIHDAWLAINASLFGSIIAVDHKLIKYRQHEMNVIGAKRRGIISQIRYTKENLDKSIEFRATMLARFSSFLERNHDILDKNESAAIYDCIEFWNDTSKIRDGSFIRGATMVFRHLLRGNYKRYNHGIYGALVDGYILLSRF